jgi:MFS family permease
MGIVGKQEGLLVTAVFGIVKFIAAIICALFLVDVIGRKRALLIGISLQTIAMIYVASFLTKIPQLGVDEDFVLPDADKGLSKGAVAMIYVSGFGWALGWNSMQYLLTAELFPLRIRALATSWAMTLHFANQYGNSRAVPNMLLAVSKGGISPKGTFWCFAAVTFIGGLWVWFSVPETSGQSLESMDDLFELPWYKIGLHGNKNAEEIGEARNEKQRYAEESHATGIELEHQRKQDV